jgi:hypothetical protein
MATVLNMQDNNFRKCLDSWKQCWNSCIATGGNYFKAEPAVHNNYIMVLPASIISLLARRHIFRKNYVYIATRLRSADTQQSVVKLIVVTVVTALML